MLNFPYMVINIEVHSRITDALTYSVAGLSSRMTDDADVRFID